MNGINVILHKLLHFLKYTNLHPKEKDCDSHCPPGYDHQEFRLSNGINVHLDPAKDIYRDILLIHNPYKNCGTLSGIVKDKHGCPIENALVQVFDSKHYPVMHVFTNEEGQYMFCLEHGNYILKAVR